VDRFPKMRGHWWYAAALGSRVLALNLGRPFNLHWPRFADADPSLGEDHNARLNDLALATYWCPGVAVRRPGDFKGLRGTGTCIPSAVNYHYVSSFWQGTNDCGDDSRGGTFASARSGKCGIV